MGHEGYLSRQYFNPTTQLLARYYKRGEPLLIVFEAPKPAVEPELIDKKIKEQTAGLLDTVQRLSNENIGLKTQITEIGQKLTESVERFDRLWAHVTKYLEEVATQWDSNEPPKYHKLTEEDLEKM